MKIFIHFFIVVLMTGLAEAETKFGEPDAARPSARSTVRLDHQTIYDATADLVEYKKEPHLTGQIRSIGDPSFVSIWAEEFSKIYPEITFDIQMGGSKQGLEMMLQGKTDLLPISRPLTEDEITQFKNHFGYEPTQVGVAFGTVGVYVNKSNPIEQLTLQQLDAIYSADLRRGGKVVETWNDLGVTGALSKQRILRFCLGSKSGAYTLFRHAVMSGGDYRIDIEFERTAGALVQAVGANDNGIGFAGIFYATQRTKFVPIVVEDGRAYPPTYTHVVSGKYPLHRVVYLVINKKPGQALNPPVLEFLRFATSRSGQRGIALIGGYPLTPELQEKSRRQFE